MRLSGDRYWVVKRLIRRSLRMVHDNLWTVLTVKNCFSDSSFLIRDVLSNGILNNISPRYLFIVMNLSYLLAYFNHYLQGAKVAVRCQETTSFCSFHLPSIVIILTDWLKYEWRQKATNAFTGMALRLSCYQESLRFNSITQSAHFAWCCF